MGKRIDIIDKQFGYWKVLSIASGSYYNCECLLCNTIHKVHSYKLRNGISTRCFKCACKNNGENQREKLENTYIKDWYVIEHLGNNRYKCRCKCGNLRVLSRAQLKDKYSSKCNECSSKEKSEKMREKLDYTTINNIEVLDYVGKYVYNCRCQCGNTFQAQAYFIKKGLVHGCEECSKIYSANKYRETMFNRYGDISSSKIQNPREVWQIEVLNDKNKLQSFIDNMEQELDRLPTSFELANKLDISCHILLTYTRQYNIRLYTGNVSNKEMELRNILGENNVVYNDRSVINPMEVDIYFPDKRIGIEFNGTYWHSSQYKDREYHQNKTIIAAKNKVKLIHIFEYEWDDTEKKEKLIKYLKNRLGITESKILYARNTKVVTINSIQEKEFLNKYHLQGYSHSSVCYGMLYENELIAVMSFGKPRFNNNYEWELVRLAYRYDIRVVGGTEKLFKRFITDYNPNNIVSYCDISKFNGGTYLGLGFNTSVDSITEPNYVWVEPINNKVLSRYQTMKHKLIKDGLGTQEQTEDEIMTNLGYYKVYDCGNLRFTWTKET